MAKAMLIIEKPSKCENCPVHSLNVFGDICCRKKDGRICLKEKPSWCPLRECPEKKVFDETSTSFHEMSFNDGYNACIDEILGGGE